MFRRNTKGRRWNDAVLKEVQVLDGEATAEFDKRSSADGDTKSAVEEASDFRCKDRQVKARGRGTSLDQARGRGARADCTMLRRDEAIKRWEREGRRRDSEGGTLRRGRAVAWTET